MPKQPQGSDLSRTAGGLGQTAPTSLTGDLTPGEQTALGDLSAVERRLAGYVAPRPSAEDTQALLARLRPLVAARGGAEAVSGAAGAEASSSGHQAGHRQWLSLAWSQTSVLETGFWWACAAVFTLGVLLIHFGPGQALGPAVALASPLLAAASVAYAFRPATRSLWELEMAAPVRPLELLYARLGLVLAVNLVVSLALIALLWAQEPRLVLWRVAVAWLGPMLGLAGAALYATVRWGAVAGIAGPLGLWSMGAWLAWQQPAGTAALALVAEQRLTNLLQSNAILGASAAALVLGLALLRAGGRLATGGRAWI